MKAISRILVTLAALLFLAVGIEFWVAPEQAALHFGIEAVRGVGMVNIRADMGALFIGLGLLCGAGAWTRRRAGSIAASLILAAAIVGRSVGWLVDGRVEIGARELAIELIALGALIVLSRRLGDAPASDGTRLAPAAQDRAGMLAVLAVGSGAALMTPAVQQAIFDRAATQMSARTNMAPLADDALRVAIAGSSAPLPSASRAKANVVVFAGGKFWVVDAGPESVENMVLWRIPLSEIGGVLLTHYHSDHIGDLGELQLQTWAGGRKQPLDVYGGPGVESVVDGFNTAYRLDQGYRTAHHGEKVMPSAAWGMVAHTVTLDGPPTPAKDRTASVYDDGVLRITAIEVDHAPVEPAYAYRFDYKGRSVVVTGDLKYHPPLVKSAMNADLLVSEAISRSMTHSLESAARTAGRDRTAAIMHDVQDYHISPEEAAGDRQRRPRPTAGLLPPAAGARRVPGAAAVLARREHACAKGDWTMADDGSLYTLPLGTEQVRTGRM